MNNELLNEIYRIQQLSGIKINETLVESNLILEQSISQFAKGVEKMLDREASEYVKKFLNVEKNIELNVKQYILQRMGTAEGKNQIRTFIKNLSENSVTFSEKFVNTHKNNLDAIASGRGEEKAKEIIKATFGDNILAAWEKIRTTPPPKPKPNSTTEVGGQSWIDITPLSVDKINYLEKLYRQKGFVKSFVKTMRSFSQNVKDMMTKQSELMDETLSLIKSYATITNSAQQVDILTRIGDNIQTLTKNDKENYRIIKQWIDKQVPSIIRGDIKSINGYVNATKVFDGTALNEWKEQYKGFSERRRQILLQLNSILNPASWTPGVMNQKYGTETATSYWLQVGEKIKQLLTGPKLAELRRFLLTGQSQGWKGIEDFRKKFGFLPAIKNVAKEYLLNYVFLSASLAVVDFLTDLLASKAQTWGLPDVKIAGLSSRDWLKQQSESWNQHIKPEKIETKNEIKNSIKGGTELVWDFLSYFKDEALNLNVGIPGIMDDILSMYLVLRNDDATEEEKNEALKKGEELRKKITPKLEETKEKVKENIDKVEEKIESFTSERFYKKYPCYDEVADTGYNSDGFSKGIKVEGDKIFIKYKNPSKVYSATLDINGKLYWNDDSGIKTTATLSCP
jgi:hypothetical protein